MNNDNFEGKIAVIGMAARVPGAPTLDRFWQNLHSGKESITFFAKDQLHQSIDRKLIDEPAYVPARGICDNTDMFDASFFNYTPLEASVLDPQQRIFLETTHQAFEHAGQVPDRFDGLIGLFAGMGNNFYYLNNIHPNPNVHREYGSFAAMLANEKDFLATRTSYKLNLTGPSISLYTACSTALVATCQAIDSLLNYQCDMALAGGVSVYLPQNSGYLYQQDMIFSKDGHCRAFDKDASGTVFGNGAGVIVLKRLSDAIAAKDKIYAVLIGAALNNDGANKMSFMSPSFEGQASVIANAQAVAGVTPDQVSFVETHGTATSIGDTIEIAALKEVFKGSSSECLLGAVKSNIGHLDAAAGIAGLIKTVLSIYHRVLPPTLHFKEPNPELHLNTSIFRINTVNHDFNKQDVIRAGVSSFGIGGTNSHVIVEQTPTTDQVHTTRNFPVLFCFSAKNEAALTGFKQPIEHWADTSEAGDLLSAAWTLFDGRAHFNQRFSFVARNSEELKKYTAPDLQWNSTALPQHSNKQSVIFLFSGQASPYYSMAHSLVNSDNPLPVFKAFKNAFTEAATYLLKKHNLDLHKELYGDPGRYNTAISETLLAQPALFVISYSFARAWESVGITPDACVGHSIGEICAAVIAGALLMTDAIDFVVARARAMQQQPTGTMVAVQASERDVAQVLASGCTISLLNAPALTVVSGNEAAITAFEIILREKGMGFTRLQTSHAFHSESIAGAQDDVRASARRMSVKPLKIPLLSNVTGTWHSDETLANAEYWVRHMLQPVKFTSNIVELTKLPDPLFIEVGPGTILSSLVKKNGIDAARCIGSSRHVKEDIDDQTALLSAIGNLWTKGIPVNSKAIFGDEPAQKVAMPTYQFQRKRYWLEADSTLDSISRQIETIEKISSPVFTQETDRHLEQLVDCIKSHPAIADCYLERLIDQQKESLFVFYVLHPGQQITLTELRKHLRTLLPDIEIPRSFTELSSIPRLPDGSIERQKLPLPHSPSTKSVVVNEEPQTEAQRYLAQLWKQVLDRDFISVSDMFFEIGGDSLSCMRVIAAIEKEKHLELNYGIFLRNNIRQIAELYNDALSSGPLPEEKKNDGFFSKFTKKRR